MHNHKRGLVSLRLFATSAPLLFSMAIHVCAESRMNLPQVAAEASVDAKTKLQVDSAFDKWASDPEHAMTPDTARLLIEASPAELRNGCREMLSDFESMVRVDRNLSVRVLHAERVNEERTAVLAFRCTVHIPDVTAYDERPAVLVSNRSVSILKLLPVANECKNCSDLYQVGYTQRFAVARGYMAELNVGHTTRNPCCDGGDDHEGSDLLLVAVPEGAKLLAFEKDTDDYNHDDENGDAQTVCKSEISYLRDSKGGLQAIDARTSCTVNGKFEPPIKASRFEWNASEKRFLLRNGH
jgi:hypothetical protein